MGSSREVIITHDVADFDGVAAGVAAAKLHPGAVRLGRRLLSAEVRRYLDVHGARFGLVSLEEIDQSAVTRMICVDVRRRSRISPDFDILLRRRDAGDPHLTVCIYDHHADSDDDLRGDEEFVEPLGAVTTLMVERLQEREIAIDAQEATLMALAIHADTGSLTFESTRARDATALAWLLEQGASPTEVDRFLRPEFGASQRELLGRVLAAIETEDIAGHHVGISITPLRRSISAMAPLTSEAGRLADAGTLFAIYPVGSKRVQVIARSKDADLDVGRIMATLGGGGHPGAGSATLRDLTAQQVRTKILEALNHALN